MTEVKENIVDLGFEDTEFKGEAKTEEVGIQLTHFPKIRPFYIPWFWPVLY